jgi:hypothetical protein
MGQIDISAVTAVVSRMQAAGYANGTINRVLQRCGVRSTWHAIGGSAGCRPILFQGCP